MLNWPRVTCSSSASMLALLLEEETGNGGHDPGFVAANDGQSGKLFHADPKPNLLLRLILISILISAQPD